MRQHERHARERKRRIVDGPHAIDELRRRRAPPLALSAHDPGGQGAYLVETLEACRLDFLVEILAHFAADAHPDDARTAQDERDGRKENPLPHITAIEH